jgi:hypothetical protein
MVNSSLTIVIIGAVLFCSHPMLLSLTWILVRLSCSGYQGKDDSVFGSRLNRLPWRIQGK